MEGVGARFGRSSTRYGPATVFTGPVRKWKKKWVHVSPSNTGSSNNNNHSQNNNNNHHSTNGASNGNNGSRLVLFKWTPLSQSQNNDSNKDNDVAAPDDPPRRKFKYIPIAVLEEQNKEAAEDDDEAKPSEADPSAAEPISRNDGFDEKPDINDTPMDESQVSSKLSFCIQSFERGAAGLGDWDRTYRRIIKLCSKI